MTLGEPHLSVSSSRADVASFAHLPLPAYAISWKHGVHRPLALPPQGCDLSIDREHIFALDHNPETGEHQEFYVVSKRCEPCVRKGQSCSRGDVCTRCRQEESEFTCITAEGWIEMPPEKRGVRWGHIEVKVEERNRESEGSTPKSKNRTATMGRELKNLREALQEMPESLRPVDFIPDLGLPSSPEPVGRSMELSGKPARSPLGRELRTLKRVSQELPRSLQLSSNKSPLGSLKVAYGSSPVMRRSSRISYTIESPAPQTARALRSLKRASLPHVSPRQQPNTPSQGEVHTDMDAASSNLASAEDDSENESEPNEPRRNGKFLPSLRTRAPADPIRIREERHPSRVASSTATPRRTSRRLAQKSQPVGPGPSSSSTAQSSKICSSPAASPSKSPANRKTASGLGANIVVPSRRGSRRQHRDEEPSPSPSESEPQTWTFVMEPNVTPGANPSEALPSHEGIPEPSIEGAAHRSMPRDIESEAIAPSFPPVAQPPSLSIPTGQRGSPSASRVTSRDKAEAAIASSSHQFRIMQPRMYDPASSLASQPIFLTPNGTSHFGEMYLQGTHDLPEVDREVAGTPVVEIETTSQQTRATTAPSLTSVHTRILTPIFLTTPTSSESVERSETMLVSQEQDSTHAGGIDADKQPIQASVDNQRGVQTDGSILQTNDQEVSCHCEQASMEDVSPAATYSAPYAPPTVPVASRMSICTDSLITTTPESVPPEDSESSSEQARGDTLLSGDLRAEYDGSLQPAVCEELEEREDSVPGAQVFPLDECGPVGDSDVSRPVNTPGAAPLVVAPIPVSTATTSTPVTSPECTVPLLTPIARAAGPFRLSAAWTHGARSPSLSSSDEDDEEGITFVPTQRTNKHRANRHDPPVPNLAAHVEQPFSFNPGIKRGRMRSSDTRDVAGPSRPPLLANKTELQTDDEDDDAEDEEEVERSLKRLRTETPDFEFSEDDAASEEDQERPRAPEPQVEPPAVQSTMAGSSELVLVQVEDTPFRLPRRQLMEASGVFNEILGRIPPLNGTPVRNDTEQVVKITGVLAKDFQTTMDVCTRVDLFAASPAAPYFKELIAVFCVARTLKFYALDAIATNKLTTMWSEHRTGLAHHVSYAAETVLLARTFPLPTFVLKRALYELLRTEGFGQLHLSRTLSPMSTTPAHTAPNASRAPAVDSEMLGRAQLSHVDLVHLAYARERLQQVWARSTAGPPRASLFRCPHRRRAPSSHVRTAYKCASAPESAPGRAADIWTACVLTSGLFATWMQDPVSGLEKLANIDWAGEGYCTACADMRRRYWMRRKEEVWVDLGVWLGL